MHRFGIVLTEPKKNKWVNSFGDIWSYWTESNTWKSSYDLRLHSIRHQRLKNDSLYDLQIDIRICFYGWLYFTQRTLIDNTDAYEISITLKICKLAQFLYGKCELNLQVSWQKLVLLAYTLKLFVQFHVKWMICYQSDT